MLVNILNTLTSNIQKVNVEVLIIGRLLIESISITLHILSLSYIHLVRDEKYESLSFNQNGNKYRQK